MELMPTTLREKDGVLISCGYVKPLYLQPIFIQKKIYNNTSFPFTNAGVEYKKGICPVCEDMHYSRLITHELINPFMDREDINDVCEAFIKVWNHREELRG